MLVRWPIAPAGLGLPQVLAGPLAQVGLPGFTPRTLTAATWPGLRLDAQGRALVVLTSASPAGTQSSAWYFSITTATPILSLQQQVALAPGTGPLVSLAGPGLLTDAGALDVQRATLHSMVQFPSDTPQELLWSGPLAPPPALEAWLPTSDPSPWLVPAGQPTAVRRTWTGPAGTLAILARPEGLLLGYGLAGRITRTLTGPGLLIDWLPRVGEPPQALFASVAFAALGTGTPGSSPVALVGTARPDGSGPAITALWTLANPTADTPSCKLSIGSTSPALSAALGPGATLTAIGPPVALTSPSATATAGFAVPVRFTRDLALFSALLRVDHASPSIDRLASSDRQLPTTGLTPDLAPLLAANAQLHAGPRGSLAFIAPAAQPGQSAQPTLIRLVPGPPGTGPSTASVDVLARLGQSLTLPALGQGTIDQLALTAGQSSPADGRPSPFTDAGQLTLSARVNIPGLGFRLAAIVTQPLVASCGIADLASPGPTPGPDAELTADDVIYFISLFSTGQAQADLAGPGPTPGPDGERTADDVIYFINRFIAGC
jgi:hypothetical protein